jgi:hypothetical protein
MGWFRQGKEFSRLQSVGIGFKAELGSDSKFIGVCSTVGKSAGSQAVRSLPSTSQGNNEWSYTSAFNIPSWRAHWQFYLNIKCCFCSTDWRFSKQHSWRSRLHICFYHRRIQTSTRIPAMFNSSLKTLKLLTSWCPENRKENSGTTS